MPQPRTQLERIAVLEEKATSIDVRTERMDGKLDVLVDWMTTEKARRRGITEVFGAGRAGAMFIVAIATVIFGAVNAAIALGLSR